MRVNLDPKREIKSIARHCMSEVQERYIDCLVDLSISSISELNDGFWLVREENQLALKQAGEIGSGVV